MLAQYNLAYFYENVEVIQKDLEKAIEYYIKAAEQGDEEAIFMINKVLFNTKLFQKWI